MFGLSILQSIYPFYSAYPLHKYANVWSHHSKLKGIVSFKNNPFFIADLPPNFVISFKYARLKLDIPPIF